jgi:hypothetical protein
MQAHSRRGRKWQRFNRKYGVVVFVGLVVVVVVAIVGVVMYMLTSMNWRPRY